jgi:hypothetical protein
MPRTWNIGMLGQKRKEYNYSIILVFHYSNCKQSELSLYFTKSLTTQDLQEVTLP